MTQQSGDTFPPFTALRVGDIPIIESVRALCDGHPGGRRLARDTCLTRERGDVVLYFHNTPIVRFQRDRVVLRRDTWLGEGWVRRVSSALGWLSIQVYTGADGVTYIRAGDHVCPMRDGLDISYAAALSMQADKTLPPQHERVGKIHDGGYDATQ